MTSDDHLTTTHLFQILEDRRVESEQRDAILHKRITELKDELYEEVEKSHKEIMAEIREMKEEQKSHHQHECQMMTKLDDRISEIEKWRWLVVGGAAAVAFIVFGGIDSFMDIMK
jgi:putative NADH-flavin reductase